MYAVTPLDQVIDKLKRRYGHDIIQAASQMQSDWRRIATGIHAIDSLLQGGLLVGCLNEFTGHPTSGTTSIAHLAAGHVQRQGYEVVYIDLEQCFDPIMASAHGMNLDPLLVVHPAQVSDSLQLIRDISIQQIPCFVVLDAGDTQLGEHYNRLELRLVQSRACMLSLSSKASQQAQVEVTFRRLNWLRQGKDISGCHVEATLNKHPLLARRRTHFELRFEGGDNHA